MFDSWGTLIETGVYPSPNKQAKMMLRIQGEFTDYITKFEQAFMIQKFDSLKQAFENVCKEFNIPPQDFVIENLIGMWNKNTLLAKPFADTVENLARLRHKYKLAMVANTDPFSLEPVLEIGHLKTDPQMFDYVLRKLGVRKNEVVMVGDSMESDILAAESMGIKAVLMDRRNLREHPNKIVTLAELDKFLK
jgi:HAD superfamily hydrolase (TIGR01549 family)